MFLIPGMITVWGRRHADSDLVSACCMHVSKYHTALCASVWLLCANFKISKQINKCLQIWLFLQAVSEGFATGSASNGLWLVTWPGARRHCNGDLQPATSLSLPWRRNYCVVLNAGWVAWEDLVLWGWWVRQPGCWTDCLHVFWPARGLRGWSLCQGQYSLKRSEVTA